MVEKARFEAITHRTVSEVETEDVERDQTEKGTETPRSFQLAERALRIAAPEPSATASVVEAMQGEQPIRPVTEFPRDGDSKKMERARANALMDAECLHFLRLLKKHKYLSVEDLNSYIGKPKDWLKIATLVRADYLEALDSMVRITPEGLAAWEQLNQLRKLSR